MKISTTTTVIKCEVCAHMQTLGLDSNAPGGHTMITVSLWDDRRKERVYSDFCSKDCLVVWLLKTPKQAAL